MLISRVPKWSVALCWGVLFLLSNSLHASGQHDIPNPTNRLTLLLNPYSGVQWDRWKQHKANFHTHTTMSDGLYTPAGAIDLYKVGGYDILALTDHDYFLYERCTWPWTDYGRDPDDVDMLAIQGMELSYHHHMLSLFSGFKPPNYTLPEALAGIDENKGLAVMCHPSLHWPSMFMVSGLQTPLTTSLQTVTRGDFTVETWFKTEKQGRNILLGNYSTPTKAALNLELHTGNQIRVFFQPPSRQGAASQILVSADGGLGINTRDGQWHHIAATRNEDALSLYLDGRLAGQMGGVRSVFDMEGEYLFVGRDQRTGATLFDGSLDNTRIWGRGLASNEIYAVATGMMPGDSGGPSRDDLLLEYLYETSGGFSVDTEGCIIGLVDDTASHDAGPFHAVFTLPQGGRYVIDSPPPFIEAGGTGHAVYLSTSVLPEHVLPEAVGFYKNLFAEHTHLAGMEVFNGNTTSAPFQTLDMELWDELLKAYMPRRPVWGWAVDDMHAVWHFGKGWMVIPAAHRTEGRVRSALEQGAYYFCTTHEYGGTGPDIHKVPRINRIVHDEEEGTLAIEAEVNGNPLPDAACRWIADGQEVYRGAQIPYRVVDGIGSYLRAELTGDGGKTFTNPFGFARKDSAPSPLMAAVNGPVLQMSGDLEGSNSWKVAGYSIYRSSDGIEYEKVGLIPAAAEVWEDDSLPADGEYTYAVTPVYEGDPLIHSIVRIPCRGIAYRDSTGEGLPDYWKTRYGLDVQRTEGDDGAYGDPDGDGVNNIQEYIAGSNPQDPDSLLELTALHSGVLESFYLCVFSPVRSGRRYVLQQYSTATDGGWKDVIDWNIPLGDAEEDRGNVEIPDCNDPPVYYRLKVLLP